MILRSGSRTSQPYTKLKTPHTQIKTSSLPTQFFHMGQSFSNIGGPGWLSWDTFGKQRMNFHDCLIVEMAKVDFGVGEEWFLKSRFLVANFFY